MSFTVPQQEKVNREGYQLPPEGRYDVTVTKIEQGRSGGGFPQMQWEYTIDSGPHAGQKFRDRFIWWDHNGSDDTHPTWVKLACIMDACGFQWKSADSIEAFALQFPLNQLRFSVDTEHTYQLVIYADVNDRDNFTKRETKKSAECPHLLKLYNVLKSEWEEWEGEKKSYLQPLDGFEFQEIYQEAQAERELKFEDEDPLGVEENPYANGTLAPDDDLPF